MCVYHLAATMRLSRAYTHNHPTNTQHTYTCHLFTYLFFSCMYLYNVTTSQRHNITHLPVLSLILQLEHVRPLPTKITTRSGPP